MNISNQFFYIHYCNCRKVKETGKFQRKITRTIQHHEFIFVSGAKSNHTKGSIIIGGRKFAFKAGMLFYIRPDELHTIEIDTEEPISFVTVHFSYAPLSFNEGKWLVIDEVEMLPLQPATQLKDYYLVEKLFTELVDCWNEKLPGYEFLTKTFLMQLIIAISKNIKKQSQNYATSLKIEKIIKYMNQNIHNRLTLSELSEMVQLSSTYLSRAFKEITGYSIIEFFNKMKIDKAKEMILEGDKKIKDIAQELGFTDEFYFSRIFKKIEGISPSEFYSKNVHVD